MFFDATLHEILCQYFYLLTGKTSASERLHFKELDHEWLTEGQKRLTQLFFIIIDLKDGRGIVKHNLDEEFLTSRVVKPYNEGRAIILSGAVMRPDEIKQIVITTSSSNANQLELMVQQDLNNSGVNYLNPRIDRMIVYKGLEVTDNLITGPPNEQEAQQVGVSAKDGANTVDRSKVFVVHGRDDRVRSGVFAFLRAAGLDPIEWSQAKTATGKGSPYVGEILEAGFSQAQAALILLTPDDVASLRPQFLKDNDPDHEKTPTGQPRSNVLFEAGMAMGMFPDRTVLVEMGRLRPMSDLAGRHTVRLDDTIAKRQDLLDGLKTAGCDVDYQHRREWQTAGSLKLTEEPS